MFPLLFSSLLFSSLLFVSYFVLVYLLFGVSLPFSTLLYSHILSNVCALLFFVFVYLVMYMYVWHCEVMFTAMKFSSHFSKLLVAQWLVFIPLLTLTLSTHLSSLCIRHPLSQGHIHIAEKDSKAKW